MLRWRVGLRVTHLSGRIRLEFQPFSVTCVTCGSRLRVGRPDLADTIVTCPKCQSMVQLTRGDQPEEQLPKPPVALGREAVDSGAVTEDSLESLGIDSASDPREAPRGFSDPPDDPALGRADAIGGSPSWQSEQSARSRRMAMMAVVVVGSVISAVILFSVLVRNRNEPIAATEPADVSEQAAGAAELADQQALSSEDKPGESEGGTEPDETEPDSLEPNTTTTDGTPDTAMANADEMPADPTSPTTDSEPGLPSDLLPENPLLPDNPLLPSNPLAAPLGGPLAAPPGGPPRQYQSYI